jgi:hypothetical protein
LKSKFRAIKESKIELLAEKRAAASTPTSPDRARRLKRTLSWTSLWRAVLESEEKKLEKRSGEKKREKGKREKEKERRIRL